METGPSWAILHLRDRQEKKICQRWRKEGAVKEAGKELGVKGRESTTAKSENRTRTAIVRMPGNALDQCWSAGSERVERPPPLHKAPRLHGSGFPCSLFIFDLGWG